MAYGMRSGGTDGAAKQSSHSLNPDQSALSSMTFEHLTTDGLRLSAMSPI